MIAVDQGFQWQFRIVRLVAPWVWRQEKKTATKLLEFAATEAGSALDMLKAAELVKEPKLRRLFFKHALDEARHAELFRAQASTYSGGQRLSEYAQVHAVRQNLFQRLGLLRFVAFVHRAEQQGQAHFQALGRHFSGDPALSALFDRIERDERFHVAYSHKLLTEWSENGQAALVRRARAQVRLGRLWEGWRRAGRRLGDVMTRAILGSLYLFVIPFFALAQKLLEPERTGWTRHDRTTLEAPDLKALRRQA